ncbi:methyltransferase domain-containing protein [Nocardioides sp. zg-579]|uniref:Methyltransferase domain-containing protein n=1 Tax=Nocardioides marmotae TaxID=2663857 RepID=A0A6I3JBU6_9ACTN|nr:class I SAM-dependent methyltransferase [Nocardioides marmotae]MCR6031957.1 methyltransferase domain-containing protein [Gordonia jinghuaiqii]MTB95597.1 methyltransferase domain-containing protein [Nocardioides marmotae]QKE01015.1 methyltransferase domain-containing protein [Nocardioides marmotae]
MGTADQIASWDAEADGFDEPADHGLTDPAVRRAWRDLLLGVLPRPPARIADLGCGTGTLSVLLAGCGFEVDGLDFSPRMIELAERKADGVDGVRFTRGDASDPPLPEAAYDVVLCRHVLWAMPDPAETLTRWLRLLTPAGRLVLVEGSWSTGAGLSAEETVRLVEGTGRSASLTRLTEPAYWGRSIDDDRYLVASAADG